METPDGFYDLDGFRGAASPEVMTFADGIESFAGRQADAGAYGAGDIRPAGAGQRSSHAEGVEGYEMEGVKSHGIDGVYKIRGELSPKQRVDAGRLIDAVLADISSGAPLDVAAHARRMGVSVPFMPDGRAPVATRALIESGARPYWGKMPLERMLPAAREFYGATLAKLPPVQARGGRLVTVRGASNGWGKLRGKVPNADKLKLLPYIDKIIEDAEWVFSEPARRESHAAQQMRMHDLLAAVEYDGRVLEASLKVRETGDGKFFYDFFNESEAPHLTPEEKGAPFGAPDTPPDSRPPTVHEGAGGGGQSRQALVERSAARMERLPARDDNAIANTGIAGRRDAVNLELRDISPDFSPEPRPAPDAPPPPSPEESALLDAALEAEALRVARAAPDGREIVDLDALASESARPRNSGAPPLWSADLDMDELFRRAESFWLERHGKKDAAGRPVRTVVATRRGDVIITGMRGWHKYRGKLSPEKLRMVPFIEDLLRVAEWGDPLPPRREKHLKRGMKIHPLRAAARLDGRVYDVGITVREDANGRFFYDLGTLEYGETPGKTSARPDSTDARRGDGSVVSRLSSASGRAGTSGVTDAAVFPGESSARPDKTEYLRGGDPAYNDTWRLPSSGREKLPSARGAVGERLAESADAVNPETAEGAGVNLELEEITESLAGTPEAEGEISRINAEKESVLSALECIWRI